MIHLDPFFQSGMIVPRDEKLPFWGVADPDSRILLSCGPHQAETLSNANGFFKAWLSPLEPGKGYSIRVSIPEKGEEQILDDIWAGEVWLASGQSNMSMTVGDCERFKQEILAEAANDDIRLFTVERRADLTPGSSVSGKWQDCLPETVMDFSAVAYGFAQSLQAELQVPVGIVTCAWGGTFIEAWISRQGLARLPDFDAWADTYRVEAHQPARWDTFREKANEQGLVTNLPVDAGNRGLEEGWADPAFDDRDWERMQVPGKWQQRGYPGSGVFWYRRSFDIPEHWQGKDLIFRAGAMDKIDVTYANGVEIGRTGSGHETAHWNQPRTYSIPGDLIRSGLLTLAVRVVSFSGEGGMSGPASIMGLHPEGFPEEQVPVAGEWRVMREQDYGLVTQSAIMGHKNQNSPHMLFDNMVEPLVPFPFKGVLWYQGESNASRWESYGALLRGLIEDWRWHFGRPDLGFYIVQLPEYMTPSLYDENSAWAKMREVQRQISQEPHVGMAVTLDLGEEDDIHPQNKIPVGDRLARAALAGTYSRDLLVGGPMISEISREGNTLRCRFEQAGAGLRFLNDEKPADIFLAGANGKFYPAEVEIIAPDLLKVSAPEVKTPCQIRYAWADHPCRKSLRNAEGFPASPFGLKIPGLEQKDGDKI